MRDGTIRAVERMELVGGRLCLDFVNTADRVQGQPALEHFGTYEDVLLWSARVGLIASGTVTRLRRAAGRSPDEAASALAAILEFRECLARIFAGRQRARDMHYLRSQAKRASMPRLRLTNDGDGFLEPGRDLSGWLLLAVAWSAIELLTSSSLARIRICPGNRCEWFFLDDSPNNRRKWCSMKTCGNRQKAREHYNRMRVT